MIHLFKSTTSKADLIENNGKYILDNICTKAIITEELNGEYCLDAIFEIVEGQPAGLYEMLTETSLIKIDDEYGEEYFRIASVNKDIDEVVIYARHITISDILTMWLEDVRPENQSGNGAINWIFDNAVQTNWFNVSSDISDTSTAYYVNKNVYEALFTADNSFLDRWGGEVYRRGFNIAINKKVGTNRGVSIRSRKNLLGFEADTNLNELTTRIYPKGFNGITIEEKYIDSPIINNYARVYSREVQFDDIRVNDEYYFEGYKTLKEAQEALKERCKLLFEQKVDAITADYRVNFVELGKTEEYKDYSILEKTWVGDTVNAIEESLDIDIDVRVIKREYDVLREERTSTELSNKDTKTKPPTIEEVWEEINKIPNLDNFLDEAKNIATGIINQGIKESYVVVRKNEILIMDTEDINTAVKVWKWTNGGLGYSSTGYYGQFGTAITNDGSIVADFINVGVLNAGLIKAGILQSFNGTTSINMETGQIMLKNTAGEIVFETDNSGNLSVNGKITTRSDNYKLELAGNKLIGFGSNKTIPYYSAGVWFPDGLPTGYVSVSGDNAEVVGYKGAMWMTAYPNNNEKSAGLRFQRRETATNYITSEIEFAPLGSVSIVTQKATSGTRYGIWVHPDGYLYPYNSVEWLGSPTRPWKVAYIDEVRSTKSQTIFDSENEAIYLNEINRLALATEGEEYKDENSYYKFYKQEFKPVIYSKNGEDRLGINPADLNSNNMTAFISTANSYDTVAYITSVGMALQRAIEKIENLELEIKRLKEEK